MPQFKGSVSRAAFPYPEDRMIDLAAILKAIEQISAGYEQIKTAVESEKDLKRRARLLKALEARDLDTIREILFEN
jgi:hypothetical protein